MNKKLYLAEIHFEDNSIDYRLAKAEDDIIVHDVIYEHFKENGDKEAFSITILNEFNSEIIE